MADFNDSLNKLSEFSTSGEVAKVNRAKRKGKANSESAKNLLGSLLDDSAAQAEAERRRKEEERRRAEEEARIRAEEEEIRSKYEAEQALLAEQKELEERKQRQAEMQAQLQRQKDIEAGLIDVEAEERAKREEEARRAAEAAAKAQKEAELAEAERKRQIQEAELERLHRETELQNQENARTKNKNTFPLLALAACLIAAGVVIYWFFFKPAEPRDFYEIDDQLSVSSTIVAFLPEDSSSANIEVKVVKQAADPKPVRRVSHTKAKETPKQAAPKASLTGGKGGLFGGPRGL